jgi:hypothetical protein
MVVLYDLALIGLLLADTQHNDAWSASDVDAVAAVIDAKIAPADDDVAGNTGVESPNIGRRLNVQAPAALATNDGSIR